LAIEVQWRNLARSARLLKLGALRCPLLLLAVGPVMVSSTSPAAAAPTGKLCSVEASFVDANFGSGWRIGLSTATQCVLGITPTTGLAKSLAFEGVMQAPLSAEAEWQAAHTPGAHEKIWILAHLGRLAPDGSSALGEIPGHGKVTAILWNTGIPINNDFGVDIEIADGFTVVGAGTSEWPVPLGRSGVDTFPQEHQNAIETLGSRLVSLFYTKTKPKYTI
jgi:hypothetical protein